MRKKRRLKRWVKETLVLIPIMAIIVMLFIFAINNFEKIGKECDEHYGRTCSLYEVEQYGKGIRK